MELYGVHFNRASAGVLVIKGTPPLRGDIEIVQGTFTAGGLSGGLIHSFQVVLARNVLSTQAELDAAEQLYRGGTQGVGVGHALTFTAGPSSLVVRGVRRVRSCGRRLVVGFLNPSVVPADAFAGFLFRRV